MHRCITYRSMALLQSIIFILFAFYYNNLVVGANDDIDYSISQKETSATHILEEIKTTEKATEIVTEEPSILYFDVPLDESLQEHIFNLCEERGIDPAIVIAMIGKESNYHAYLIGDNGNSLGLMQIQPRWHRSRMEKLGCTDLLDPYQNVTVGIDLLGDLLSSGKSVEWALMAYNGGSAYANRKALQGVVSSYAQTVLRNSKQITYKM